MTRFIKSFSISILALFMAFVSTIPAATIHADSEETEKPDAVLSGRGFYEPEATGNQIDTVTSVISATFAEYNGKLYAYSMTNGGYFNALDVESNTLVYSQLMPGVSQSWGHTADAQGNVYIAALGPNNDGQLYRYKPNEKNVELLGTPMPGHQFWSITTDDVGNVYIGTHKEHEGSVVKYDVELGTFKNMGKATEGNETGYVRSIAYHDGYVYLGTGVRSRVIKMNAVTGEKEDITKNAYDIIDKPNDKENLNHVYNMAVAGNYLVARFDDNGEGAILFYNLIEEKWEEKTLKKKHDGGPDDFGAFGWDQLAVHNNKTYVTYERKLHEVDLETLEAKPVGGSFLGHRGGAVYQSKEGLEFVSLKRLGDVAHFNLDTGKYHETENILKGTPVLLHNLGKDNDGNLYVSSYPGGPKGMQVNLKTNTKNIFNQMQAEGMTAGDGNKMYFGLYSGAIIQEFDTQTLESKTLFNLKDEYVQDRPYIIDYQDGLLMMGTIPYYKELGGVLALYNPETKEKEVHRNVVQNQSIVGLAKRGNLIFGSTTIRGGLDASTDDMASKPVIFVWDIEKQEKVKEIEIPFPEIQKTPMISGLTFDESGQLWGAVDGVLFTMDPETMSFTKHKDIYPDVKNRGMWRPVHIEFGEDGLLYTDLAGRMTVVDPSTEDWKHTRILTDKEVDFMTLSKDADGKQAIYILQNAPNDIEKIRIVDVDPLEENDEIINAQVIQPLKNGGFEDMDNKRELSGNHPTIPGWSSLFEAVTANVSFEVTTERAYEGEHSLKIVDQSDKETVFVKSDNIPVHSGIKYTASVQQYLTDGQNTVFIRFFDESGKQVGKDIDGETLKHIRSDYGKWNEITVSGIAPEGAVYTNVTFGSSNYFQTSGAYYDAVKLTSEHQVIKGKTAYINNALKHAMEVDTTKYTDESVANLEKQIKVTSELLSLLRKQEAEMITGILLESFEKRVTQEMIQSQLDLLNDSVSGLKLKEKPIDPVDPVDPIDPVDPVDPINPVDPIDPVDPVDPIEPSVPVNPETDNKTETEGLPATGVEQYNNLLYLGIGMIVFGFTILNIKKFKKE